MRVIGIVAEYNPFHKGHEYLINEARKAVGDPRAVVMSIMSGPFTQRGLPAVAPKHIRAKQALRCGSNVVLELPFEWACAPASEFARGAVASLLASGVVTDIAFGIDAGSPDMIRFLSDPALYTSQGYESVLKDALSEGASFPSASARALIASTSCPYDADSLASVLRSPNCILAVEYLKAMKTLGAGFNVHMIERKGQGYSDDDYSSDEILSASSIRKALSSCRSASAAADVLCGRVPDASAAVMLAALSDGSFSLCNLDSYAMRAVTGRVTDNTRFCSDGLASYITNVFADLRQEDMAFGKMSAKLATKHFTMPRIYRALTSGMLNVTSDYVDYEPGYIRVLGFDHEGRYCLKIMGKCSKLPVIHNPSDLLEHPELEKSMRLGIAADDLACTFTGMTPASSWNIPPVIIK